MVITDTALVGRLMLVRNWVKERPQTVTDNDVAAATTPVAVNTTILAEMPLAAVARIPVVAEAGAPLTIEAGNVTVILSEVTRAVANVKPMTI